MSKPVIQVKESDIQRCIIDYLRAEGWLVFRRNVGAISATHNGRKRFVRFGHPGEADLLAFPKNLYYCPATNLTNWTSPMPLTITIPSSGSVIEQEIYWIEVKGAKGKQSDDQKAFEQTVKGYGHKYILARDLNDVISVLK